MLSHPTDIFKQTYSKSPKRSKFSSYTNYKSHLPKACVCLEPATMIGLIYGGNLTKLTPSNKKSPHSGTSQLQAKRLILRMGTAKIRAPIQLHYSFNTGSFKAVLSVFTGGPLFISEERSSSISWPDSSLALPSTSRIIQLKDYRTRCLRPSLP